MMDDRDYFGTDERLLQLVEWNLNEDENLRDFDISIDEFGGIIISGYYWKFTIDVSFEEDFMRIDSYTIATADRFSSQREYVYSFLDANAALEAANEWSKIVSAVEPYNGVLFQM